MLGFCIQSGLEGLAGKDRKVVVKGLAEKEVEADKISSLIARYRYVTSCNYIGREKCHSLWVVGNTGRRGSHTRVDKRAPHEYAVQFVRVGLVSLADGHLLESLAVLEGHEVYFGAAWYRHLREAVASLEGIGLYVGEAGREGNLREPRFLEGVLTDLGDGSWQVDVGQILAAFESQFG